MTKIQEKWRDSLTDINDIEFKRVKFEKIINYPPAGNDVFECIGKYKGKPINFIFKSERGEFADFSNEIKVLNAVNNIFPVPKVLESGKINKYIYIALSKIQGEKLSDIFKEDINADKSKYLYLYGQALAKIHRLDIDWKLAKIRDINDYPSTKIYKNLDDWDLNIIKYLKDTKPIINYDTFIHGDFHYGNILWDDYKITGILDWEYSGNGFKEQDIAWSLILRPGQRFMDDFKDLEVFLNGYKSINNYDKDKLKWCLINGSMHFYLMYKKQNSTEYLGKLKQLICFFIETL